MARKSNIRSRTRSAASGSAARSRSISSCRSASGPNTWARTTPGTSRSCSTGPFLGILIENFAGAFPLWLAPEQVVVMNISEHQADYAETVAGALRGAGWRAVADLRNEKISYKIREHSLQKLPYQVVVGDKEKQAGTVAVRTRGGEDLGAMPLEAFIARLTTEAKAQSTA